MRSTFSAVAALAAIAGAQSTTSIDIAAISVPAPTEVFVLPVVYVTEAGAPVQTATTLAATATASSDAQATNVFDSSADVSAAISSASELAIATSTPISRIKRDTCVQQPLGISYNSVPDTAAAFAADAYYGLKAVAAGAPTGYVQTMSNLTASNSADKYMGFTLLPTYDVVSCVNQCNAISGCNSVNIYFERDPSVNPDSSACQNPSSTVNIKCVFWGGAVVPANANNFGQWRENFQVLIAGSNGYMKSSYASMLAVQATATSSSSSAAASATDAAGNIYTIYYSSDSTTGAYSNAQASSSYKDCMTACDADSKCNAFTYVGGTNGVGSGTCWLKASLGSPSSSGNNVISGTRSGKAVSSSSSSTVSTTSSSTSSSASSTSKASTTTSATSISSTASATSSSTSSSSAAATLSPTFSLTSGDSYSWLAVAPGANGATIWNIDQNGPNASDFKFRLNLTNGYLLEAQGASTGYAATVAPATNGNGLQQVFFNPVGGANTYVSCVQNTAGTPHLDCKVKNVLQQAYVCDDNWNNVYLVPVGGAVPNGCYQPSGIFYA
ncbi:hypothetical protein E4T48_06328 [Aureobasidium sp. EXF-10727]|nr:hypothetical protein E4T48_06328 [Aureobasidium sp. EXF-10727]